MEVLLGVPTSLVRIGCGNVKVEDVVDMVGGAT